jgi:SAM-dependent methyltransferase
MSQLASWERFAPIYDEISPPDDDAPDLQLLRAAIPRGSTVLELGAGTGRIAIPLHRMGHTVTAVDLSPSMLAQLRRKDHTEGVRTVQADMCDVRLTAELFDVVLCLCNTLAYATSADRQRQVMRTIRHHLAPGGFAIVHNASPCRLVRRWIAGPAVVPSVIEDGMLGLTAGRLEIDAQRLDTVDTYVRDGVETRQTFHERYIWPAELKLMAELEGLRVSAVYGDWNLGWFDDTSRDLIARLEHAADAG